MCEKFDMSFMSNLYAYRATQFLNSFKSSFIIVTEVRYDGTGTFHNNI